MTGLLLTCVELLAVVFTLVLIVVVLEKLL